MSIPAIGEIARTVGGDSIRVEPLAPGLRLDQIDLAITAVEEADLVLINGFGLEAGVEDATERIADSATLVAVAEVAVTEEVVLSTESGERNPFLWLTPRGARGYVTVILDALARLDPVNVEDFQARATALDDELAVVELAIEDARGTLAEDAAAGLASVDEMAYVLGDLSVTPGAIDLPSDLGSPEDHEVRAVIKQARSAGVSAIFGPPGLERTTRDRLREAGVRYFSSPSPLEEAESIRGLAAGLARVYARTVERLGGDPVALEPLT